MQYQFRADRARGLLDAKGFERKHLLAFGFKDHQLDDWLYRKSRPAQPTLADGARLAQFFEVPLGYLVGAPTRYDRLETFDHVAAEASLDIFLDTTDDGRLVTPDLIPELRALAGSPDAPKRVEAWRTRYESVVRFVQFGQTRDKPLRRMLRPRQSKKPEDQTPRSRGPEGESG